MNKMLKEAILTIILAIVITSCQSQETISINAKTLDSLANEYLKLNPEASGVIAVVSNPNDINWKYATGFIDQRKTKKLTGKELFIAASITKTFMAAIILQMEEEGKLSIKDKVINYLNKATIASLTTYKNKSYENELTIEHLLRHTSGIFDYLNEGKVHLNAYKNYPNRNYSLQDRIDICIKQGNAKSKPGKYYYSNTNYILLGMIAEKIDKKLISKIFDDRIIKPLKLNNTTLNTTKEDHINKMMKGYYTDWNLTSFTLNFNKDNAAGGILTSVNDLVLFSNGLFTGKLFKKVGTLKKMLDFKKGYGLGVMKFESSRKAGKVYGHSGFDPGYTCYMAYMEKFDCSIINVINQSELRVVMPAFLIVKTVAEIKK